MIEKIRVAIVMTAQRLCAMKLESDGKLETISLDGNTSMKYTNENDFKEFADYIKKFYNVNELDDIDFSVVLLKVGVDAEKASKIIDIFKIVSDLYVLDANDFESVFDENSNIFKANDVEIDELKAEVSKLQDEKEAIKVALSEMMKKLSDAENKNTELQKLQKLVDRYENERASNRHICYVPEFSEYTRLKYLPTLSVTLLKKDNSFVFADDTEEENDDGLDEKFYYFTQTLGRKESTFREKFDEHISIAVINVRKANGSIDQKHIKSHWNGKVFYLKKNDESVKGGEAFAIIGDMNDTREDVMEWYKNQ